MRTGIGIFYSNLLANGLISIKIDVRKSRPWYMISVTSDGVVTAMYCERLSKCNGATEMRLSRWPQALALSDGRSKTLLCAVDMLLMLLI